MKSVLVAILSLGALPCVEAGCTDTDKTDCPPQKPLITFEALALTAGPYGEMWEMKYGGSGELELEVNYMLEPNGDLSGKFLLSTDDLQELRTAVREHRFFDLPKDISPKSSPIHAPDLRLKISFQGRTHVVRLYDPDSLSSSREAAEFMAVWRAAFALVPPYNLRGERGLTSGSRRTRRDDAPRRSPAVLGLMKTGVPSAAEFNELLRAAIAEIESPKRRGFIESKLITPYQTQLHWEYGQNEPYVAWVFADMGERKVVGQYCLGGYGARGAPWGINFREASHFGQDSGWYDSLAQLLEDWGVEA